MKQALHRLVIETPGPGLIEVTRQVAGWMAGQGIGTGLLTIWCRHTSVSLLVQENADPDVRVDLQSFFSHLAPESRTLYRHSTEGPDDMPAHIRAALTTTQLSIPVQGGRPLLG